MKATLKFICTGLVAAFAASAWLTSAHAQEADAEAEGVQRFKDWAVACPKSEDEGKKNCQAVQRLTVSESGKQVMQISVAYLDGQEDPVAIIILPLGMLLQTGALLTVDGEEIGRLGIQRCEPGGCIAPLVLDEKVLGIFKSGTKGQITVQNATGKDVPIPLSLSGFTAALAELKK